MRPKGSADLLGYRRQLASQLLDEGKELNEVARLVKASPSSVHRWKTMKGQHSAAGLKAKSHPGRPSRLTETQKAQLLDWLVAGPLAAGYDTDLWTCDRVATLSRKVRSSHAS